MFSTSSFPPNHARPYSSLSSPDIELISKFAQLEFKYGEPERGRTMFESLVSSYPRRVDLWSVFVDMMLKQDNAEAVR